MFTLSVMSRRRGVGSAIKGSIEVMCCHALDFLG